MSTPPAGPSQAAHPVMRIHDGSLAVMTDGGSVLHYDLEGRPLTLRDGTCTWRRVYDGRVLRVERDRARSGRVAHRALPALEADTVTERFRATMAGLAARAADGPSRTALGRADRWTPDALAEDAARYRALVRPGGVFPPDCYRALLVQLATGCPYNRCTFCTLYQGERYHLKRPEALREWINAMLAFLGRAGPLFPSVFLGDADALAVAQHRLLDALSAVREAGLGARGVYAFGSAFTGPDRSAADVAELVEAGLSRVYLGVESGAARLLRFLRKPYAPSDVTRRVRRLKEGGASVGLIFLAGAGGGRLADAHVRATVGLVGKAGLSAGDFVYVSPLLADPDYVAAEEAAGLDPLGADAIEAQAVELKQRLEDLGTGARVAIYDIGTFPGLTPPSEGGAPAHAHPDPADA